MKFVSVDDEVKRVAHTSGVIEMIGKDPVDLDVYDEAKNTGHKGLMECAMAAGCIPFNGKAKALVVAVADVAKFNKDVAALTESEKVLADQVAAFEAEKAAFYAAQTDKAPAVNMAGPAEVQAAPLADAPNVPEPKTAAKAKIVA